MKKLFSHILSLFVLLTISGFGVIGHASAMPMSMHQNGHDSSHTKHTSSSSNRCVTLCTSAVFNKDDDYDASEDELDDKPAIPFYVQQPSIYDATSLALSRSVYVVKPPPKVPIYILHSVFRV